MSGVLSPLSPGQAITLLAALTLSSSWGGRGEPVKRNLQDESAALRLFPVSSRPIADAEVSFDTCCNADWSVQPTGLRRFEAVHETTCNDSTDYIYSGTHTGAYPFYAGAAFDFDLSAVPIGAKIDSVRVVVCATSLPLFAKGELKGNISYWDPDRDGVAFFENDEGRLAIAVPPASSPSNPFTLYDVATARLPAFPPSAAGKTSTSKLRLYLFGDNVAISQIYLRVAIVYEGVRQGSRRSRVRPSDCASPSSRHPALRIPAPHHGWRIPRTCFAARRSPHSPPSKSRRLGPGFVGYRE